MVRKQIYVTEDQHRRLRRAAARQHRTEADILREALDRQLAEPDAPADVAKDPFWGIIGLGRSEAGDLSENADHYLYGRAKKAR